MDTQELSISINRYLLCKFSVLSVADGFCIVVAVFCIVVVKLNVINKQITTASVKILGFVYEYLFAFII